MDITFGLTYQQKYLEPGISNLGISHSGLVTLKRVKTNYGYRIMQGTNYISLHYVKLIIFPNGKAKAVVKVDKNYHPKYQYTLYFDRSGREIKDIHNRTRKELAYWKKC